MQGDKAHQEISIIGRFLSLEALVFVMGLASLLYGLFTGSHGTTLLGVAVLAVAILFYLKCRQYRANGRDKTKLP